MISRRVLGALVLAMVLAACTKSHRGPKFVAGGTNTSGGVNTDAFQDAGADGAANEAPANDSQAAAGHATLLNVSVSDEQITGLDSMKTGAIEIRLTNRGKYVHQVRLRRLPSRLTAGDAIASINRLHDVTGLGLADHGGAGPIEPGVTISVVEVVQDTGTYFLLDELNSPDGTKWVSRGLLKVIVFTGSNSAYRQPPLMAAASSILDNGVALRFGTALMRGERSVQIEGRFRSTRLQHGDNVIKIDYLGGPGHDLVIMKTGDPMALHDYFDWVDGARRDPPPGINGGIPGLYPARMTFYLKVKLEPGTYTIFCARKLADGTPHFELGELEQVWVY